MMFVVFIDPFCGNPTLLYLYVYYIYTTCLPCVSPSVSVASGYLLSHYYAF